MKILKNDKLWIAVCSVICIGLIIGVSQIIQLNQTRVHHVILIPKGNAISEFWMTLVDGAEMAANEYEIELDIYAPDLETDIEAQKDIIRSSIQENPDAIVVAPSSFSETTDVLQEVVDAGIHLILMDSIIDEDIAEGVVATDNFLAGEELGQYARSLLNKSDDDDVQIGIIGHVEGASTAIDRENGVRSGLGEYEGEIEEVVFCDSSYDKAEQLMKEMVEQYPELDLVIGLNENAAVGAARAIKELEISQEVMLLGFDSSLEEVMLMEEGIFEAIIIQKPFNMGYLSVQSAKNIIMGDGMDKEIDSGSKLITPNNLYEEENQRLLFPINP